MRKMGLEPTRLYGHKILSLACLPIPALPRNGNIIASMWKNFNTFFEKLLCLYLSGISGYLQKLCVSSRCACSKRVFAV